MDGSKKEKGTINSTQDSVKNQGKYNQNKKTVITLLENLENELIKKYNFITENYHILDNQKTINSIRHIRKVAKNDPRLPWIIIQKKIDATYLADRNISGVRIVIKFEDLKENVENFNPQVYGF